MPREGQSTRGRYRMADHGQQFKSGGLPGMHILKDGCGASIWKPTWNKTRTVFRPFPGLNPDNLAEFDAFRMSDDPRDFGEWIRKYTAVTIGVGQQAVTFILYDPRDGDLEQRQSNPAWMLRNSIYKAVKNGQCPAEWNPLVFGGTGRPAPLKQPSDVYLIQGVLMEHKSEEKKPPRGFAPDEDTVIMMLPQSAGNSILDDWLERRVKNADGSISFEFPDIVSLTDGAYIGIGEENTTWPDSAPASIASVSGGNSTFSSYECRILPTYNGLPASLEEPAVRAKVKDWDAIIRIPTLEEQLTMICESGIPPAAILYGLGDRYRDLLPEHIVNSGNAQPAAQPAAVPVQPAVQPAAIPQPPVQAAPLANDAATGPAGPSVPEGFATTASDAQVQAATPPQGPDAAAQPTHADPSRQSATQSKVQAAQMRARDRNK